MDTILPIRSIANTESPDLVASIEPEPTLSGTATQTPIANVTPPPEEQLNLKDTTSPDLQKPRSAASRVFETTELLLMILFGVSASDLLINGLRVNKTWKAAIDTTHWCQARLCFKPVTEDEDREGREWFSWRLNPLLGLFEVDDDGVSDSAQDGSSCYYDFGPTDSDSESHWSDPSYLSRTSRYQSERGDPEGSVETYFEFDWSKVRNNPTFARETASWRKMLAMNNPSMRELWYFYRPAADSSISDAVDLDCEFTTVQCRRGVIELPPSGKRLGEIFDEVMGVEMSDATVQTRTIIRSSSRYTVVVTVNVLLKEFSWEDSEAVRAMDEELDKRFGDRKTKRSLAEWFALLG